ncbi:MAG TPA: hypothetical protein VFL12_10260 [Thermoanaerobaculia bacterium]|nr:hypothetical protein [Thermoanaerobaculia bacterium]
MRILMFLLPGVAAGILSFLLTPLTRLLAYRLGAIDVPDPRKIHERPIPRLGGLAVIVSSVAAVSVRFSISWRLSDGAGMFVGFALGLLPILIVSFADDVRGVRVRPRVLAQVLGASIAVAFGIRLGDSIHLFGLDVRLGAVAVPLSILWIVGVTNAFNLVDGLDGLSAGLALISASSLAAISLTTGNTPMSTIALILSGALLGFLPYNVYPASVFLGDVGATFLGFSLACLALVGGSTLTAGMAVLVPIPVIGVPIAETLVSMLRRLVRRAEAGSGGGVFEADREHMHHRLLASGSSQGRAVMILCGAALVAAGCGFVSMFLNTKGAAILFATLVAAAVIGVKRMNYDEFAVIRRGVVLKIYGAPVLRRAMFPVFFDLFMVVVSVYLAIGVRDGDWALVVHRPEAVRLIAILPAISLLVFAAFRLYRGPWSETRAADLLRCCGAVLASGAAAAAVTGWGDRSVPLSFVAIYSLVLLVLVAGSRISYRILAHGDGRRTPAKAEAS